MRKFNKKNKIFFNKVIFLKSMITFLLLLTIILLSGCFFNEQKNSSNTKNSFQIQRMIPNMEEIDFFRDNWTLICINSIEDFEWTSDSVLDFCKCFADRLIYGEIEYIELDDGTTFMKPRLPKPLSYLERKNKLIIDDSISENKDIEKAMFICSNKLSSLDFYQESFIPSQSDCLIKGNISYRTGEKIYHLPGCPNYNDVVINERYGERWFCTEQEALNAGWRKAYNCP